MTETEEDMIEDTKESAALALRNAFWRDFSALANVYLLAAKGLDVDCQESKMGDMTSIYGRDTKEKGDFRLNIRTISLSHQDGRQVAGFMWHESILEALERKEATEVQLQGKKIFERSDGEWVFTDFVDHSTASVSAPSAA